ncbi:MAG: hypothetical protein ACRD0V_21285 [Acidimicrobiales bacterium]
MSDASSRPLTAAAEGFVALAGWLGELARTHIVDVARATDEGRLDATTALARSAALPLIGWVALANEVLDAATVITLPPQQLRESTADKQLGRQGWEGKKLVAEGFVNAFGERLPDSVHVSVEPETLGPDLAFTVRATGITHDCVGVYSGIAHPEGAARSKTPVPVWLVVP